MENYLVIADDFTGANDTGLQLARKGLPTRVQIVRLASLPPFYSLVIDTESRNLDAQDSCNVIQISLSSIDCTAFSFVMKKINSTLRGNIREEVLEVARIIKAEMIVLATAFPDLGRTCKDGVVYVNDVPLLQTEHGKDPLKPVREDNPKFPK